MARIPPPGVISHIQETPEDPASQGSSTGRQPGPRVSNTDNNEAIMPATGNVPVVGSTIVPFTAGLPPVPNALVKRIQEGEFVDMSELTVDSLSMMQGDESSKSNHSKKRPVTSIIEWAQCFTNYIAILSQAKPTRTLDLLGYQHLVLEAHLEYSGDGWMIYDRRFRQIAATRPAITWAQRDGDLWHMAFGSNQRRPYCQYCFGSTHSSWECNGAPDDTFRGKSAYRISDATTGSRPPLRTAYPPKPRKLRICWEWNYSQCTFPGCQYIHACRYCHGNPHLGDSNHKFIHCPRNRGQQPGHLVPPLMGPPF